METSAVRKEPERFHFRLSEDLRQWAQILGMESQRDSLPSVLTQGKSPNIVPIRLVGILGYLRAGSRVFADSFKGGEADGFGLAGFENGEVGSRDADFVG